MKRSFRHITKIGVWIVALGALVVSQAEGKWAVPPEIPITRLLKNTREYIKAHPREAEGYYTLGRINSAAFAEETTALRVFEGRDDGPPQFPGYTSVIHPRTETKPLSKQALIYLADALRNYKKATELNPDNALAFLGLGFQCEETFRFPQAMAPAWEALSLPQKPNADVLRQQALKAYRKAYALTISKDLQEQGRLVDATSQEAAEGIMRLQKGRKLTAKEEKERDSLQANLDKLRRQPRAITPILISFRRSESLSDLQASGSQVHFDLDGSGAPQTWPWIKPTTGILVWDPKHTGKITSGLQLFGNVTWWLFWKDGYAPLAALDNNRDGWLAGRELEGLAVWFDRNGNGVSDSGEVVSLSSVGVRRIAVRATGQCEGVPYNRQGVQLTNGSYAATFDWTPTALSLPPGMAHQTTRRK